MKLSNLFKAALVGFALMGSVPGCSDSGTTSTVRATSRTIRGKVPVRTGANRITKVVAINAKTRRVVASAIPAADGTFVISNVVVGATYRIHAIVGNRSIPITFPKARGATAKTNLFNIGTKSTARIGPTDGDINVGDLSSAMEGGEEAFNTPADNAPNLQEDFDEDGTPDGADTDIDNDGMPNDMDPSDWGDGADDRQTYGDLDGDGITNESDPDVDGDGTPNAMDADNDNDGTPDAMDSSPNGDTAANPSEDTDGDGVPNTEDSTNPDDNVESGGGIPQACMSCAMSMCQSALGACVGDTTCAACLTTPAESCRANSAVQAVMACACESCASTCGSICMGGSSDGGVPADAGEAPADGGL